ncbi:cobalt-precorrin-5B (C(1))-methyltransferase [Leptolyngbya sp. FACHB-261]|nr:cobalt-precorrin-5B (C(1))-methyltransferase [Leptolyngbya sp. FACHB-261]
MEVLVARAGYTLPVFACAATKAALLHLQGATTDRVALNLIEPETTVEVEIEQVARLSPDSALAVTRSDPGDNLDLTRNTPIWAQVQRQVQGEAPRLQLEGGEGLGIQADGSPAIYAYARKLFATNIEPLLAQQGRSARVQIILPEGRKLAQRTSNAAFGVVEGLSLLGTTGISQPLSAPEQLADFQAALAGHARQDALVFCIGENGLDLASQLGINPELTLKTANWLGAMLVAAAQAEIKSLLLLGYHGKLIKLAAGIFHTHHSLADARAEILTAYCALAGLPPTVVEQVFRSETTDAALLYLLEAVGPEPVQQIYAALAEQVDQRAEAYIRKQSGRALTVGSLLFDRRRQIIVCSGAGQQLLTKLLPKTSKFSTLF